MEENDPYREDLPGNKKESGAKKSLELGYQSDSEDGSVDSDNPPEEKQENKEDDKNEDDDDMFASDEEEKVEIKDPRLLDMKQFVEEQGLDEAPVTETKVYGTSEVEQLQDYYANIENGATGNKKSLPEVQLEAFNLQEEAEHGTFDKDMNYTRGANSDEETAEDAWMSGVNSKDIEKARKAQESLSTASKKVIEVRDTSDLLQSIVEILEPAETTLEALSRLRPAKKKKDKKGALNNDQEKERKKTVFELTECCEQLINSKGVRDVYDMSREELMRMYKRETGQDIQTQGQKRKADALDSPENSPEYGDAIWEFRWLGDTDINGPYSSYEMKYWVDNYFENKVEVRRKGSDHFVHVQNVHFDE